MKYLFAELTQNRVLWPSLWPEWDLNSQLVDSLYFWLGDKPIRDLLADEIMDY